MTTQEGLLHVEPRADAMLGTGSVRYRLACHHGQSTGTFIPATGRLSEAVALDLLLWRHHVAYRCRM
ncbi:MAG: hypothetical protein A2V84_12150 [Chloroflexi bacterium RBG_16_70_13]|nr:MAG: hypothetical protein A2V84_12150 [Chloroflexi bacterium RBG_16_70_13]